MGVPRAVGHELEGEDAEDHGRHPFQKEEPLPAAQPEPVHSEEGARHRRAQGEAERDGDDEAGQGARAALHGEPVGEVNDQAGEEAGLGDAEKEARGVELRRRFDEGRGG